MDSELAYDIRNKSIWGLNYVFPKTFKEKRNYLEFLVSLRAPSSPKDFSYFWNKDMKLKMKEIESKNNFDIKNLHIYFDKNVAFVIINKKWRYGHACNAVIQYYHEERIIKLVIGIYGERIILRRNNYIDSEINCIEITKFAINKVIGHEDASSFKYLPFKDRLSIKEKIQIIKSKILMHFKEILLKKDKKLSYAPEPKINPKKLS